MQPIFPEIDLSRFLPGGNGSLVDQSLGVMAGLNSSLLAWFANFSPSDLGIAVMDPKIQIALSVPDWASWTEFQSANTESLDAGTSTEEVLHTIPDDERAVLQSVRVNRLTGDNTINWVEVLHPALYAPGNRQEILHQLSSADTQIFWPDYGGDQTCTLANPIPPLLEPGSQIRLRPAGAGAGATVFTYYIRLKSTKLVRAIAP